jgi:hypothetical protein
MGGQREQHLNSVTWHYLNKRGHEWNLSSSLDQVEHFFAETLQSLLCTERSSLPALHRGNYRGEQYVCRH